MATQCEPYVLHDGMSHVGLPATEDELRAVEANLGRELPAEYRQFLREVNGVECGEPLSAFRPCDRRQKNRIFRGLEGLYSVNQLVPNADQLLELKTADYFKKRVPRRFLAIGYCHYWDLVCISLGASDRGTVYYWDDPRGDDEELIASNEKLQTERFLFPAGKNFREFWNSLFPPNRDAEGRVTAE